MADINAASTATTAGVEPGTHSKQALAWARYKLYLKSIAIQDDDFLEQFTIFQRNKILGAFAHALRDGRFYKNKQSVKAETIRAAIDSVAQTYRMANRPDPRLDQDGRPSFLLLRQLRGYKKFDPPSKQQAALTGTILRELNNLALTRLEKVMCELFTGAFFFAMRSCEYLKVSGKRRTKIIELGNIRFFKGRRELTHSDKNLRKADSVSITFELQKRDTKSDTITQYKSNDKRLCPVIIWANIVQRIRSYPSSSNKSTVNTYVDELGNSYQITGPQLLKQLRRATTAIGHESLGFHACDIGLHSARSGAAMAMYLAGVPVYTIMLLGRWSSDAFLRYIRKQVKEFSKGVSSKMLINEDFFTIPKSPRDDAFTQSSSLKRSCNNNGLHFKEAVRPIVRAFC